MDESEAPATVEKRPIMRKVMLNEILIVQSDPDKKTMTNIPSPPQVRPYTPESGTNKKSNILAELEKWSLEVVFLQ